MYFYNGIVYQQCNIIDIGIKCILGGVHAKLCSIEERNAITQYWVQCSIKLRPIGAVSWALPPACNVIHTMLHSKTDRRAAHLLFGCICTILFI
ncbi:hypothetical protein GDO86_005503 [Hymenochirus boettgeri]|uniref:Uncharacterized protein n=1 Tax=Hymenochirus boettgeri TaxID=247094 RepID=A0A8T2J244_9PIPI|nr:hypothetical protein GDO86_005503 [Hymenochirus boettgeri]